MNCEISLIIRWSKNCVLTSKATRVEDYADAANLLYEIDTPTSATFKIANTKLYVPVYQLLLYQLRMKKELLEQLETGFKRTMKWNKYRSEMSNQSKYNNLNYLIDPTKVNRLFLSLFENEEDRTSFSKYYVQNVKLKHFNVLFDGRGFFDTLIINEEEAYETIIEISKNNY